MMWVFEGIALGKWVKRKTSNNRTPPFHFRRFNLSLMSCSPAELISVSIEQFKFQFNQLYLQTVEKSNHLPVIKSSNYNKIPLQLTLQLEVNKDLIYCNLKF